MPTIVFFSNPKQTLVIIKCKTIFAIRHLSDTHFSFDLTDIVSTNEETDTENDLSSSDIKHSMTLLVKTIMSILMVFTYIITIITTCQILLNISDNVCLDLHNSHSIFSWLV